MITVENIDFVHDDGSVVIFVGDSIVTGDRITFAVDHRVAADMIEQLELEIIDRVAVESWQILGRPGICFRCGFPLGSLHVCDGVIRYQSHDVVVDDEEGVTR